ncbi:hypothetical protein VP01_1601g3 [Puccinia sorghi]|uniref:DDE Tnp4 domain-containing protein n=1 Tax=Puccinia sorghi TaxID=27349 RepID=A0A0L6VHC5_9BASI|nr:hypothetical protein VP01_1601g3 [Puccinia sorghi]
MKTMYSQTCRFLSSLKNSLIKISSFWKELIQVISIHSQLIKGRNCLAIEILISITILHSHDLREMRTEIRNHKYMKVTIKWIISCIFLHNLLVELKDKLNPDFAPVVVDNIDNSNDGIHGILHPITLSHFEESK